jgi:hypothetical protein
VAGGVLRVVLADRLYRGVGMNAASFGNQLDRVRNDNPGNQYARFHRRCKKCDLPKPQAKSRKIDGKFYCAECAVGLKIKEVD